MYKSAKRKSVKISILLCIIAVLLAAVAVFGIWHTVAAGFTRDDQYGTCKRKVCGQQDLSGAAADV